ncbi:hypothetical protein ACZ87_01757, partial [Candidatus Erwinia dacicola]
AAQRQDRITGIVAGGILSANSDLFNKAAYNLSDYDFRLAF